MELTRYDPPNWLDRLAKEYWRRVAPTLVEDGSLNAQTVHLLSCAAAAYSSYREAQAHLKEEGRVIVTHTGASKVNPWLAVEKQAFEVMARVHKELREVEPTTRLDYGLEQFLTEGNK